MPEFGQVGVAELAPPAEGDGAAPAPWTLEGVMAQTVTFEVDRDAALALLPEALARPAPPYARIQVTNVPDSPAGAYREAQLLISCRYMMTPRQYLAASVVSSAEAAEAITAAWGYQPTVGEVSLSADGNDFTSTILADDVTIGIASVNSLPTGVAVIRYDPTVTAWRNEGDPAVYTLSAEPTTVHEAWLARNTTVTYSGGNRANPWLRLRSRNFITATIARLDLTRPEPAEVQRPTGAGGGLP